MINIMDVTGMASLWGCKKPSRSSMTPVAYAKMSGTSDYRRERALR
jgi:hypothetical protein